MVPTRGILMQLFISTDTEMCPVLKHLDVVLSEDTRKFSLQGILRWLRFSNNINYK